MTWFAAGRVGKQLPARECALEIATQIGMERVTSVRHTAAQRVVVGSIDALWSKKEHKSEWSTTPRDEHNKPGNEKYVTNLPIHPGKLHAQKPSEAIWKEQAWMEHISRTISRRIRNVKDRRLWWKPNKVEILTQIKPNNHTKRWTQQTRRMNTWPMKFTNQSIPSWRRNVQRSSNPSTTTLFALNGVPRHSNFEGEKEHKSEWSTTPRDEHNKPGDEKYGKCKHQETEEW